MGRPEENQLPQSSGQTGPFQPPLQGYPVPQPDQIPFQPAAPQGYPNQHDNPLSISSPLPPPPQVVGSMTDKNLNPQSTPSYTPQPIIKQPPPSHTYPPQQPPVTTYPHQQPHVAYAPQAAYPPQQSVPVANATSYIHPQSYMSYTPNHNPQPQVVNYVVQPQVTTGTPNWHQQPVPVTSQEWSTGLLDCFYDPENAIVTLCFPCVTFGQIAEVLDNGQTLCATSGLIYGLLQHFTGFPCILSCSYRTKLRNRYNLLETPAPDWLIHLFCECCALCQEYRELKNRGMDPSLGWHGNLSKHQNMANHATMTPPTNQRMG